MSLRDFLNGKVIQTVCSHSICMVVTQTRVHPGARCNRNVSCVAIGHSRAGLLPLIAAVQHDQHPLPPWTNQKTSGRQPDVINLHSTWWSRPGDIVQAKHKGRCDKATLPSPKGGWGVEHGDGGTRRCQRYVSTEGALRQRKIKGKDTEYPQLRESEWLSDLVFAVDLFEHMNELNTRLQGKGTFAHEMYSTVKAFRMKLKLFSRQLSQNITTHLPTLETMAPQMMSSENYTNMISTLDNEFALRFADFQKLAAEFDILSSPFTTDFEKVLDALQLELTDLQCDCTLKEKFQSESIDKFYASLNESKFANLRNMAMKLLVLFGSTYVCEQTFSTMNINKTNLRSNLTDVHVQSLLRISTSDMSQSSSNLLTTVIDRSCLTDFSSC
ncbi:hypothetical protein C0Q70_17484 [Pomacea canaliculata]|uniref:HAT C-terminal dimerisation domain-containing protein n=1 Tax=Pomacea canaliculata TaxID=400727 RepID=A0A2T7NKJ8_POMCA|nr:hypothetical protein C0Q70_17484 [Pomacea canaliculata]